MAATLKLRQLESILQEVDGFERPKILLEQYETPAHIAACMLHTAQTRYNDIQGKSVADLGCGTGVLAVGASVLDAAFVAGFDVDTSALAICRNNLQELEISVCDLVQCDVTQLARDEKRWTKSFDTVLMNPPFGTKHNRGIDVSFLIAGLGLARSAVYSLHKSATRQHILKKAKDWNVKAEVVAELRYNLAGGKYKHHTKAVVDIEVDFIRLSWA